MRARRDGSRCDGELADIRLVREHLHGQFVTVYDALVYLNRLDLRPFREYIIERLAHDKARLPGDKVCLLRQFGRGRETLLRQHAGDGEGVGRAVFGIGERARAEGAGIYVPDPDLIAVHVLLRAAGGDDGVGGRAFVCGEGQVCRDLVGTRFVCEEAQKVRRIWLKHEGVVEGFLRRPDGFIIERVRIRICRSSGGDETERQAQRQREGEKSAFHRINLQILFGKRYFKVRRSRRRSMDVTTPSAAATMA